MRVFYLFAAIVGTVVPWLFFGSFFAVHGADLPAFVGGLFTNGVAAGFSADVLIAIAVFVPWAYRDAQERAVRHWWLVVPATLGAGLSLALPLYLRLRTAAHPAVRQAG